MDYRILLALAIMAMMIIFFLLGRNAYLRSIRLRERTQLNAIFTNITHELLTPLTVISASVDKYHPRTAHTPHRDFRLRR